MSRRLPDYITQTKDRNLNTEKRVRAVTEGFFELYNSGDLILLSILAEAATDVALDLQDVVEVRQACIEVLGSLMDCGYPEIRDKLRELMKNPDENNEIRRSIVEELADLNEHNRRVKIAEDKKK